MDGIAVFAQLIQTRCIRWNEFDTVSERARDEAPRVNGYAQCGLEGIEGCRGVPRSLMWRSTARLSIWEDIVWGVQMSTFLYRVSRITHSVRYVDGGMGKDAKVLNGVVCSKFL